MTKIIYIAHARMPTERAHGIQIVKMGEALLEAGADLELVVPSRGRGSPKDFYGLSRPLPLRRLPALPLYRLGRFGYALGALSFMLSYSIYLLRKRLTGEKFVGYTIDMDQFSFLAVALICPVFFIEIHDAKKRGWLFDYVFKKAEGVITINSIIKKKICGRFGLPAEKVLVFPNGIDLRQFGGEVPQRHAREKLGLPPERKIVIYTGSFIGWKGMNITIESASALPGILFWFVGGTEEEFKKVSGARELPPNMRFAGRRPYAEMPIWHAAADCFIVLGTKQSEYSYYHTSPMKLFEYLPSGRPIVASGTPAIRDVVSEREVYFYQPDNASDLAGRIREALSNSKLSGRKSAAASEKAREYSWDERGLDVLDFIKSKTQK